MITYLALLPETIDYYCSWAGDEDVFADPLFPLHPHWLAFLATGLLSDLPGWGSVVKQSICCEE